ncbi:MAG: excisionase family DNA-binding protein [Candidatus Binataceae bacterium]|jgi:excisionase family DNA binding protein
MSASIRKTQGGAPLAISIARAAELLGVSAGLVRLEIERGHLAAIRFGRRVLVPHAEILRRVTLPDNSGADHSKRDRAGAHRGET